MYTEDYRRNHARVIRAFGKASGYQCTLCFNRAQSWAHLWRTHPDKTDPYGYVPMCWKDHYDYDKELHAEHYAEHSERMRGNQYRTGVKFKPGQNHGGAPMGNRNRLGKRASAETRAKMSASHRINAEH